MRSVSFLHWTIGRLVFGCIALCVLPRVAFADNKTVDWIATADRGCISTEAPSHGHGWLRVSLFSSISLDSATTLWLAIEKDAATSHGKSQGQGKNKGHGRKFKVPPGHRGDDTVELLVSLSVLSFTGEKFVPVVTAGNTVWPTSERPEFGTRGHLPVPETVSVPEPAVLVTLSIGLAALAILRRKNEV